MGGDHEPKTPGPVVSEAPEQPGDGRRQDQRSVHRGGVDEGVRQGRGEHSGCTPVARGEPPLDVGPPEILLAEARQDQGGGDDDGRGLEPEEIDVRGPPFKERTQNRVTHVEQGV